MVNAHCAGPITSTHTPPFSLVPASCPHCQRSLAFTMLTKPVTHFWPRNGLVSEVPDLSLGSLVLLLVLLSVLPVKPFEFLLEPLPSIRVCSFQSPWMLISRVQDKDTKAKLTLTPQEMKKMQRLQPHHWLLHCDPCLCFRCLLLKLLNLSQSSRGPC